MHTEYLTGMCSRRLLGLIILPFLQFVSTEAFSVDMYMVTETGIFRGQLFNNSMSLHKLHNWGHFTRIITDTRNNVGFFYESAMKVIYKTDLQTFKELKDIVIALGKVEDMAADDLKRNVYWTDSYYGNIGVANYDGVLITTFIGNLGFPKALALDSYGRILFWSDLSTCTIENVVLDGSNRSVVLKDVIATDIELDTQQYILYIYEDYHNKLLKLRLGSGKQSLPEEMQNGIKGISGFPGGFLTFSISSYGYLELGLTLETRLDSRRMHYYTRNRVVHQIIVLQTSNISGMPEYRNDSEYRLPTQCGPYCMCAAGSFHLNFTKNSCIKGIVLRTYGLQTFNEFINRGNNKIPSRKETVQRQSTYQSNKPANLITNLESSCTNNTYPFLPFLLVADQRGRVLYKVDPNTMDHTIIPVTGLDQPYGIAFDTHDDKVYWTDIGNKLHSISRSNLDGSFQEIILHYDNLYSTDIEIDSDLRLAFFVDFSYHRIGVLHLQSLTYTYILKMEDLHPFSLFIEPNSYHHEVFIATHGTFPRIIKTIVPSRKKIIVTEEAVKPRGIYVYDKQIFWIESYKYDKSIKMVSSDTGNVSTVLHGERYDVDLRDIEFFRGKYMFITDVRKGHLLRFDVSSSFDLSGLIEENRSPNFIKMHAPSGLSLVEDYNYFQLKVENRSCSLQCEGVCLGNNECLSGFKNSQDVNQSKGFCRVPASSEHLEVHNAYKGSLVHNGYQLSVSCDKKSKSKITCINGSWTNLPRCLGDTKGSNYCGDASRGWVLFRHNSSFQILPEMRTLSVISIGGGGGGFDNTSVGLHVARHGGYSQFLHIKAEGGKGGTATSGGKGGAGNYFNGRDGELGHGFIRGGNCIANNEMSQLFCGNGSYTSECTATCIKDNQSTRLKTKKCNTEDARYGGGGAGHGGGSGGGGGFSCGMIYNYSYPQTRIVDVIVGTGGDPSYAMAESGMVLVTWEMGDACALTKSKLYEFN